jgi:hypothetical protein
MNLRELAVVVIIALIDRWIAVRLIDVPGRKRPLII